MRDRIIFTLLNLSLQKLIFLLLQLSVILRLAFKQHVTFIYDSQHGKTLSKMKYSHYSTWCVEKWLGIRIKWLYLAGFHCSLISFLCLYLVKCKRAVTYVASNASFCTLDVHKHSDSMLLQEHLSAPCLCIRTVCWFVWSISHDQSFAHRKTIRSLSFSHDFYLIFMNVFCKNTNSLQNKHVYIV